MGARKVACCSALTVRIEPESQRISRLEETGQSALVLLPGMKRTQKGGIFA